MHQPSDGNAYVNMAVATGNEPKWRTMKPHLIREGDQYYDPDGRLGWTALCDASPMATSPNVIMVDIKYRDGGRDRRYWDITSEVPRIHRPEPVPEPPIPPVGHGTNPLVIEYDSQAWHRLVEMVRDAEVNKTKVSLSIRHDGIALKVGEGMWTPVYSAEAPLGRGYFNRYRTGSNDSRLICRECSTRSRVIEIPRDEMAAHDAMHDGPSERS